VSRCFCESRQERDSGRTIGRVPVPQHRDLDSAAGRMSIVSKATRYTGCQKRMVEAGEVDPRGGEEVRKGGDGQESPDSLCTSLPCPCHRASCSYCYRFPCPYPTCHDSCPSCLIRSRDEVRAEGGSGSGFARTNRNSASFVRRRFSRSLGREAPRERSYVHIEYQENAESKERGAESEVEVLRRSDGKEGERRRPDCPASQRARLCLEPKLCEGFLQP
jgi:hypothetical protein